MSRPDLDTVAAEPYCYLTTTGRRSGRRHTIEIWFATDGRTVYLISGGGDRSDWVRNLRAAPSGRVRITTRDLAVTARAPMADGPERTRAAELLHAKYHDQVAASLADWRRDAYLVALDPADGPA